ncbi:MAG: glutamate--cysteine ligase, partial [Shewanella sp.]
AVEDPNLTLSGQVLQNVLNKGQDHGQWVMTLAQQYYQYFVDYPLSNETIAQYQAETSRSLNKQAELEVAQRMVSFDDYLEDYFGVTS